MANSFAPGILLSGLRNKGSNMKYVVASTKETSSPSRIDHDAILKLTGGCITATKLILTVACWLAMSPTVVMLIRHVYALELPRLW